MSRITSISNRLSCNRSAKGPLVIWRPSGRVAPAWVLAAALAGVLGAFPATAGAEDRFSLLPIRDTLVVSRIQYQGNTFGNSALFPDIFSDPSVSGVQGKVFIDQILPLPGFPRLGTTPLDGITTSFSSKSEGALLLSANGAFLTYIGYEAPVGANGVSNSETPGATLTTNTSPTFNREVALISAEGQVTLTPETNAYSGDNPRAAISVDGQQFYMAGNGDSSLNPDGTGPGTTLGARYGTPGSDTSIQLGTYLAVDRPDESKKQHIKDNNFRGIGIFNGNLYISKGSGGNGDNGIFQVHLGSGDGLPVGTGNSITQLLGGPATDPVTKAASAFTPFGFFFADATTLYLADEGTAAVDAAGNLLPDPYAGLQKWSLVDGAWRLDYVLREGLRLGEPEAVNGYPALTHTTGLRNMTGKVHRNGVVTLYAITAQFSTASGGEPDPTKLVVIADLLEATSLPTGKKARDLERFVTLQASHPGEVFRGVAFAPARSRGDGDDD